MSSPTPSSSLISETPAFTQRHQLAVSVFGQRAPRRMAYNFSKQEKRPEIRRKNESNPTRRHDRTWRREDKEIYITKQDIEKSPIQQDRILNEKSSPQSLQPWRKLSHSSTQSSTRSTSPALSINSQHDSDISCLTPTSSTPTASTPSSTPSSCNSPMSTMSISSDISPPSIASPTSSTTSIISPTTSTAIPIPILSSAPDVIRIYPACLPTPDNMDLSTVTPQRRRLLATEIIQPRSTKPSVHELLRNTRRTLSRESNYSCEEEPKSAIITYDSTANSA